MNFIKKEILCLLAIATSSVFVVQCKKESDTVRERTPDSSYTKQQQAENQTEIEKEIPKPNIHYTAFIFPAKKKDSAMQVFKKKYSEEERYTILALNRLDQKNSWRADTLMIPDKIDKTLMSYSPFPRQMEMLKNVNKMVIFSYPIQAYAVYQKGELLKWGPSSMGKKAAQTKRGLMFGNWKKELAISTVDSEWKLPYNFNVHNSLGIGWHQYDLPGFPASHSCLRLLMDDAKWLYNFADTWILNDGGATVKANGTPVIVFGEYKWGGRKPWKALSENPSANDISVDSLNAVLEPHLAKIIEEQEKRAKIESAEPVKRVEENLTSA